jgi:hypothetical protein
MTDLYKRLGSEFLVNTASAGAQHFPTITGLSNGNFVITWWTADVTQDGNGSAIKAQVFNAAGSKVGAEFLVNSAAANSQYDPTITGLSNGNFVVTWQTYDAAQDGNGSAIKAQVFSAAGAKVGTEFLVNTAKTDYQSVPKITGLSNGNFVVTWRTDDSAQDGSGSAIKAQVFNAAGSKVGTEFLVNTAKTDYQQFPTITGLTNGNFVVTWSTQDSTQDGSYSAIKAQVFSAAGSKVGSEFLVNTAKTDSQQFPTITGLTNGNFVVTWSTSNLSQDGNSGAIKAQVFSAAGAKVGSEFLVNTATAGDQSQSTITGLSSGGFVVTWHTDDWAQDGSGFAIKAQVFSATGAKVGSEFLVNTATAGDQYVPTITGLSNGGFVVTWYTADTTQDGSGSAIKAQIFSLVDLNADNVIDGTPDADTLDGGGGNDTIYGSAGDDLLFGGTGNDVIDTGPGQDTVDAGAGDDQILVQGTGTVDGGGDRDVLRLVNGGNLTGLAVSNVEFLETGGSLVTGTIAQLEAFETITVLDDPSYDTAAVTLQLADGGAIDLASLLDGRAAYVTASAAGNAILGTDSADVMNGGVGDDSLDGGEGEDSLYGGGGGNDTLVGGGGNDLLQAGNDGAGTHHLDGGAGDDTIYDYSTTGGEILGGTGNDRIQIGWSGGGTVDGGADRDVLRLANGGDLTGLAVSNVEVLETGGSLVTGTIAQLAAYETITVLDDPSYDTAAVTLQLADGGAIDLSGLLGQRAAHVTASAAGNAILGTDSADVMNGGVGDDSLDGGEGADVLYGGGGGNDTLVGGGGNDLLQAGNDGAGTHHLDGGAGDDL